jgi:hypothetical protein
MSFEDANGKEAPETSEAALKKAREISRTGCYNLHAITPRGPRLPFIRVREYSTDACRRAAYSETSHPPGGWATSAFPDMTRGDIRHCACGRDQRPIEPLSISADLPKLVDLRGQ